MSPNVKLLVCLLFISTNVLVFGNDESSDTDTEKECQRLRKPWQLLSTNEKAIYTEGYKLIRKNKMLRHITRTHSHTNVEIYVHDSSLNPYWHSYLVYELESAIRNLGGKFTCFGMPYWDYGLDAGQEGDPEVLNSGIGTDGVKDNEYCIENDAYAEDDVNGLFNWKLPTQPNPHKSDELAYWTPNSGNCGGGEVYPMCCLKRAKSTTQILSSSSETAARVYSQKKYRPFLKSVGVMHSYVHILFGANTPLIQFSGGYSTDDPMFFILHAFIDYLRVMWTSCHGYDKIDKDDLVNHEEAYSEFCMGVHTDITTHECHNLILKRGAGLDDKMRLWTVCAQDWALCNKQDITVKTMWDISDLNIKYELGPWFEDSGASLFCSDSLNTDWFVQTMSDYQSMDEYGLSDVNAYSAKIRQEMASAGYSTEEIMSAVQSKTCKYVREHSENSCWDQDMEDISIATCDGLSDEQLGSMNLQDFLDMDGVKDHECLKEIRKNTWGFLESGKAWGVKGIKRAMCNGELDYKCTEWNDNNANDNEGSQQTNVHLFAVISVCALLLFGVCSYYDYCKKNNKVILDINYDSDVAKPLIDNNCNYGSV